MQDGEVIAKEVADFGLPAVVLLLPDESYFTDITAPEVWQTSDTNLSLEDCQKRAAGMGCVLVDMSVGTVKEAWERLLTACLTTYKEHHNLKF